jgi:hypothetical protein
VHPFSRNATIKDQIMELEVGLTSTMFAQLVRAHGTLRERASMRGNDIYQLQTTAGTYSVPARDGGPPGDFPSFKDAANSSRTVDGPFAVVEQALNDPEVLALLSQVTIKWKRSQHL